MEPDATLVQQHNTGRPALWAKEIFNHQQGARAHSTPLCKSDPRNQRAAISENTPL